MCNNDDLAILEFKVNWALRLIGTLHVELVVLFILAVL